MGYIRSNEDWYQSQGDFRSSSQRAQDLRDEIDSDKHMPDSIREELEHEIKLNEKD